MLEAYGWGDVGVPPYCVADAAELTDVVTGLLFALNARRGAGAAGSGTKKAAVRPAARKKVGS